MGRHSAVDDDDQVDSSAVETDPAAIARGRHSRGQDVEETGPVEGAQVRRLAERAAAQDDQPTERLGLEDVLLEPVDAPADALPTEPPAADEVPVEAGTTEITEPLAVTEAAPDERPDAPPAPRRPRGSQATAADLALLRRQPAVRNRVIAAVVVPFVLYVAALLIIGAAAGQYLLWLWIPLVTAGVGGGLILDTAHRKHPPEG